MNFIFKKPRKSNKLPLYLVIGLPKSGKSTFIAKNIKLLSKKALLPNISLFASEQGYFLEISLTPQPIAIDLLACIPIWEAYQLQGIFILSEAVHLVQHYQAHHKAYESELFNEWLMQLARFLKMNCPVHIILSQSDKIAGFESFFEYLLNTQNGYWLGFDLLPEKGAHLLVSIEKGFASLKKTLQSTLLERLYQTENLEKQRFIQQFPHQMNYVQAALMMWVQSLDALYSKQSLWHVKSVYKSGYIRQGAFLEQSKYNPAKVALLKMYVAPSNGATQHLPVSVTYDAVQSTFQKSSYFIGSQYCQYLCKIDPVSQARRKRIYVIWPITLLCVLTAIGALFYFYQRNVHILNSVKNALLQEQSLHSLQQKNAITKKDFTKSLEHCAQLHHALVKCKSLSMFPVQTHALEQALQEAYTQALKRELWPHLQFFMEQAIQNSYLSSEASYKVLKAWLMLKEPKKANRAFLIRQLSQLAQPFLASGDLKASFERDIEYLMKNIFSSKFSTSIDFIKFDQYVYKIRTKLLKLPAQMLILFALNSVFEEKPDRHPFQYQLNNAQAALFQNHPEHLAYPAQYSMEYFSSIYTHKIPQLTKDFIMGKDWVLRDSDLSEPLALDSNMLIKAVRIDWLTAYANTWKATIKQLQLIEIDNWKQFSQTFRHLKRLPVLFEALIATILQHTQVEYLQHTLPQWKLQDHYLIDHYLSQHFQPLNILDTRLILTLEKLQDYLAPILKQIDSDKEAFHLLRQRFVGNSFEDPLSQLFEQIASLPEPFAQWINSIAIQIRNQLFEKTQCYLNRVWHDQVFRYYKAKLDNRYPLFKKSLSDIELVDFINFFSPQGRVENYLQEYLAPFIDRTKVRWQLKQYKGKSIAISTEVMSQLGRAYVIKQLFAKLFAHSRIPFKLTVMNITPPLKTSLEYGGSLYPLTESLVMSPVLYWPSNRNDLKISVHSPQGIHATQSFHGLWAWFHLVDAFKKDRGKVPIILSMPAHPYTIGYELCLAEEENIFIADILEYFRCPVYLTA